jgi:hypothetical protein
MWISAVGECAKALSELRIRAPLEGNEGKIQYQFAAGKTHLALFRA